MIGRKEVYYALLLGLVGSLGFAGFAYGIEMSQVIRAPIHHYPGRLLLSGIVVPTVSLLACGTIFFFNFRNVQKVSESRLKIFLLQSLIAIVSFVVLCALWWYLAWLYWDGYVSS